MRTVCVLCVLAVTPAARAGGLVVADGSPRAIGRAGAGTVGDDGAGALLVNPAAIARRDGARGQIGFTYLDDEVAWQSTVPGTPIARDQAPSNVAPYGGVFASYGDWVIGLGAMTAAVSDRSLRRPSDIPNPDDFGLAFEYRYLGLAGASRRDTVTLGVARRIGESLALGVAFAGSRVQLAEVRRLWAGFSGTDMIGSPGQDLEVSFSGADAFVPSAVAGVLFAPEASPIELGASLAWSAPAHIAADVLAIGTRPDGPSPVDNGAAATLEVAQPMTARLGARYVGDRFVAELGGELAKLPASASDETWKVLGMSVAYSGENVVPLESVPSRVSQRTHGAVHAATDVELFAGFLWATAGYSYTVGGVNKDRQSPTFGDLGGHTLGLGLEARTGGFTLTFGWSRTWATARTVVTTYALDNPFHAGDRTIPGGTIDGSVDQVGILVDAELSAR